MKTHGKKILLAVLLAGLGLLSSCGGRSAAGLASGEDGVDLDLTRLSSAMVYTEVYHMRYEPEPYYGKVVRIQGLFSAYENPETGEPYFNCVIPDAAACCSQGLQFFPAEGEGLVYPEDFPENGTAVTVVGTFSRAEQNPYMCAITDASMTLSAGAESGA